MILNFVLDACTALSWSFEDERNEYAEQVKASLVDSTAWVPRIWVAEIANGIVTATRRQRIDATKTAAILDALVRLPIEVHELEVGASELADLSLRFMLSAYDALYLHLAHRSGLPLASLDGRLDAAGEKAGVPRYKPPARTTRPT